MMTGLDSFLPRWRSFSKLHIIYSQCLLASNEVAIRLSALNRWTYFSASNEPMKPEDEYLCFFKAKTTFVEKKFSEDLHAKVKQQGDGCVAITYGPFDDTVGLIYTDSSANIHMVRFITAFEKLDEAKKKKSIKWCNEPMWCSMSTFEDKKINRYSPHWLAFVYVFINVEVRFEWIFEPFALTMAHRLNDVYMSCVVKLHHSWRILRYAYVGSYIRSTLTRVGSRILRLPFATIAIQKCHEACTFMIYI